MEQQQIFIQMALHAWHMQIKKAEKFFFEFTDEQLMREVAPGKNRCIYLLGHLTAYHDLLPEILGLGTKAYPTLQPIFLQTPDNVSTPIPSLGELKSLWTSVHQRLDDAFAAMPPADWFTRHNAMTDEDFSKDPTRNKLSVLLNRTSHVAYHLGQVIFLK